MWQLIPECIKAAIPGNNSFWQRVWQVYQYIIRRAPSTHSHILNLQRYGMLSSTRVKRDPHEIISVFATSNLENWIFKTSVLKVLKFGHFQENTTRRAPYSMAEVYIQLLNNQPPNKLNIAKFFSEPSAINAS